MNRNQAKEFYPILQAFAEGKVIETRTDTSTLKRKDTPNDWTEMKEIEYWNNTEYRIKPEVKFRPFKDEEECWNEMLKHKPFGWIFSRKTGTAHLIRCIDDNHVFTSIQYSFDSAFKGFVFADLVPFGVKVEE